jgi:hypothetical protein
MKKELYRQAAYHESGHIIMAYLCGYKCDEVALLLSAPGNGFSKIDYGDRRYLVLIASMQNYIQNPDFYNEIDSNLKKISPQIAIKACGTLMGGPVSEALYLNGVDFEGNLEIEMSGPDLTSVSNIDSFLYENTSNHNENFINMKLLEVTRLLKDKNFWNAVVNLSEAIINSPNMLLNRTEIEESLNESGYLEFIS